MTNAVLLIVPVPRPPADLMSDLGSYVSRRLGDGDSVRSAFNDAQKICKEYPQSATLLSCSALGPILAIDEKLELAVLARKFSCEFVAINIVQNPEERSGPDDLL